MYSRASEYCPKNKDARTVLVFPNEAEMLGVGAGLLGGFEVYIGRPTSSG